MPDPLADLAQLPGVPAAVTAATAAVDAVLRDRGLRRLSAAQLAAGRIAAAKASADLTAEPDRWRPGAVRLSTQLDPLAAVIRVAPAQALARVHALVARGVVDDAVLGRVAAGEPVATRMAGVVGLLTGSTTASAVVLAAVVHAELATVAPFGDASGLVARAAEQLVLMSCGLDPTGAIAVAAGHLDLGEAYPETLTAYARGDVVGVKAWILHCCAAVARGADLTGVLART